MAAFQGSRLAAPDPQAEQGRGAIGVAAAVDGEDADRVPAASQAVDPGRGTGAVGLAVELAAEARAALAGREAEDGAGAGLGRGKDRRRAAEDPGPRRGAVANHCFGLDRRRWRWWRRDWE